MSSDDADDERETSGPTPNTEWADSKSLKFTLFVALPNEEVCTLRDLSSGISVFDVKGRLELVAGVPYQLYTLRYPDGEELPDDATLVLRENILHGYVLKMRLLEAWDGLYMAITRNNIEQVYHSGGVHLKGNCVLSQEETSKYETVVKERGGVALYMAAFQGQQRMLNMLLSVGISTKLFTYFGRTALHAAAATDQAVILQVLVNNGADISQKDCYGASVMDVAKEMNSCLCLRQLRIIHLNSRCGGREVWSSQTSQRRNNSNRHSSGRTHSTLSQYSETNSILKKRVQPHASQKHVSSSAPSTELRMGPNAQEETESNASCATTGKVRQKQNVKWKDGSTEYWKVVEIPKGVEGSVSVRQVSYALPRTIMKFSEVNNRNIQEEKEISNKQEEKANTRKPSTTSSTERLSPEIRQAMRYAKQKLHHYKNLSKPPDDYIPMSERKPRSYALPPPEDSPAFKAWLAKKDGEDDSDDDNTSETSGEYFNQSDPEEDRMVAFNKKVRKMNKKNMVRSLTPGNRPMLDIMTSGSTVAGDARNPPAEGNIKAYQEWRNSKNTRSRNQNMRSSKDLQTQKQKLEEKRQKLLMKAISYDEWLDHTEERKFLLRQILKADFEETKRQEEEKRKDRQRLYSYDIWKDKLQKRENDEKKRKRIQRHYEQKMLKEKLEFERTSHAVPFEDWLQRKGQPLQRTTSGTSAHVQSNLGQTKLAQGVN